MKKRLIILSVILVICLTCGILYTVWAYNNPRCQIVKAVPEDADGDFYIERISVADSPRLNFQDDYPESWKAKRNKLVDDNQAEILKYQHLYTAPTRITAQCEVKDDKTIVTYSGTATNKSDGKTVDVNDQLVFDFVLTKDISYES